MTDEEIEDALESYQREQENVGWDIDCMRATKLRAEPVAWRIKTKNGSWLVSNQKEAENWGDRAEPLYAALPRSDASDPRYVISEVEGRFYVQRAGTDTVVAEFTDPPRSDEPPTHRDNRGD
jgi:hypothetical protein